MTFCTVHLPSPRYGLQHILDRKTILDLSRKGMLNEETAHRWRTAQQAQRIVASLPLPVIVAGDFNMPVHSAIYRQYWGGYSNAFSSTGFGYGWTERAQVRGVEIPIRIDHVLAGDGFRTCLCETGPDVESDHLPLIADVARVIGKSGPPL